MRPYIVVIPAYQPMKELHHYVNELLKHKIAKVIVVDDGNLEEYEPLFEQLKQFERCIVLHHTANQGKGAALKTGFKYYLEHFSDLTGVVTVDADGQHRIKDILSVGNRVTAMNEGFVLGSRVFERENMPIRSYIGNTFTSHLFRILFGVYINDTQTGLRGITTSELARVNQLAGEHFDFEMNMLIAMIRQERRIVRVDIEAVYADEHTSTFDTYRDTVKIASLIAKKIIRRT